MTVRTRLSAGRMVGLLARSRLAATTVAGLDLLRNTGVRNTWRHQVSQRTQQRTQDARNDEVYDRIWGEAANTLCASMSTRPSGIRAITLGDRATVVWRQWVMLDDTVTVRAALDKRYAHQELRRLGLPTPEYREIRADDFAAAAAFLGAAGTSLVVKPAAGTGGGLGTTACVRTEHQLARALLLARRRSDRVLLEEQIPGQVYRLLFLEGELLDVVRRLPPHVSGDGKSTIAELIRSENEHRLRAGGHRGMPLITMTLDCVFTLERAGLTLRSIPEPGRRVQVKTVTNQSGPDENFTVRDGVAPEVVTAARDAAAALGVRLAGIDVVTTDPSRALADTGGVVLEVNAGPGLHHHYHVADPENATRVCVPILARLLEASTVNVHPQVHGGALDDR